MQGVREGWIHTCRSGDGWWLVHILRGAKSGRIG